MFLLPVFGTEDQAILVLKERGTDKNILLPILKALNNSLTSGFHQLLVLK